MNTQHQNFPLPAYVDSHTHLHFAAYDNDREEVARRTLEQGVWCINVGTQKDTSRAAVALAQRHEGFFATVGVHPIHTSKSYHDAQELGDTENAKGFTSRGELFDKNYYLELGKSKKVVAIGECGLDYFRLDHKNPDIQQTQKDVFEKHIELAATLGKPLMCHCRPSKDSQNAYEDLYEMLKPNANKIKGVVIHFFVGDRTMAKKFADLGFYFTFGGVITFTRNYDEVIFYLPLDKILCETDAPYVTPEPHRGARNEPAYVVEVYKKMAVLKNINEETLRKKILENNARIFEIPHPQHA